MPNTNRIISPYIQNGDPDTMNVPALYAPGDLGAALDFNDRAYQIVHLDSGCTNANAVGVVAANMLAFWKDKDAYLVTNDDRQAIGHGVANAFRNQVAGLFRCAATAGNYICILQRGDYVPVLANAGGGVGQTCIAFTTGTAAADWLGVGVAITYQKIGVGRVANALQVAAPAIIDLDIPNIP